MFTHYLQTALRNLWRFKFTTAANVLCLAFGLSCFMFGYIVVDWLQQTDPGFVDPEHTYVVMGQVGSSGSSETFKIASTPEALVSHLKTNFPGSVVTEIDPGFTDPVRISVGEKTEEPVWIAAQQEFTELYGLKLLWGDSQTLLVEPNSVVLSEALAKRLFGEINPVGMAVTLNTNAGAVVRGVYAELQSSSHLRLRDRSLELIISSNLLDQLGIGEKALRRRSMPPQQPAQSLEWKANFPTYVRLLKDNSITSQQVDRQLQVYQKRFPQMADSVFSLMPARDLVRHNREQALGGAKYGPSLVGLTWVFACVVLAIAIANYANLTAAQTLARGKEVGLRRLLGAERGQVFYQCWLETLLICSGAALLAVLQVRGLMWFVRDNSQISVMLPVLDLSWPRIGHAVMLVPMLVLMTSIVAAAYPGYLLAVQRPGNALRAQANTVGRSWAANILVGMQFCLAGLLVVLLITVQWQQHELKRASVGELGDQVIMIVNYLKPGAPVGSRDGSMASFASVDFEVLRTELLRFPQVQQVASSDGAVWLMSMFGPTVSRTVEDAAQAVDYSPMAISANFFSTLDIPLLAGRYLDDAQDVMTTDRLTALRNQDADNASEQQALIQNVVLDQRLAAKLGWPEPTQAIGQLLYRAAENKPTQNNAKRKSRLLPMRIVGVVASRRLRNTNAESGYSIYSLQPRMTGGGQGSFVLVKLDRNDLPRGLQAIDTVWNKLAPGVELKRLFADEVFALLNVNFTLMFRVVAVIAGLALGISVMSIVGMSMHALARRTHEVGVRKSLGASTWRTLVMLLRDFSKPMLIANLVVWPIAYLLLQIYLSSYAYRIALNPLPFIAGLVFTVLVACCAIVFQVSRIARLNPAQVLRYE